jgi:hypothetical protein
VITRVCWDVTGTQHEIDWTWTHSSGDWWVEIETVDGETPDLTDEQLAVVMEACADAYPLAQYQDESATDAEYYDR